MSGFLLVVCELRAVQASSSASAAKHRLPAFSVRSRGCFRYAVYRSGERRKVLWKGPVSPLEVARKAVLPDT